uniref:AIPR family protein n=1 Tax=uncultured Altererythrobacter sp. TaxID=500840 RepID=UPI0026056F27|nr:AIPR family protein [uncultured Altererythrobacter sp.]
MPKQLDNSQVVLDDILKVLNEERAPTLDPSEFFELFCAEQMLKDYELSYDELDDGIVDGEHDGGVDSVYAFANGELITDDFDPATLKKSVHVELFIIQSKTSTSIKEEHVNRLISITQKLLNLSNDVDSFSELNEQVRAKFRAFRDAYRALVARFPSLAITYVIAAKRADEELPVNLQIKLDELAGTARGMFDGAEVQVNALGAAELRDLAARQPQVSFELRTRKSVTADEGVIALCKLQDYNEFLRDGDGRVRKTIFDLNVRDFQGNTEVNAEIKGTLNDDVAPEFWWMNNGVTILAEKATVSGDIVTISGPQVVNGLQTSTQIYEQFDEGSVKNPDQSLLVKIISSEDEETRDRIIKATNSQNAIQPATLRATDKIQRDIEATLKARGLFYDRRKNFYKNQGRPAEKIVSIPLMAQSLMAVLLGRPDDARARPSSLIKNDSNYIQIFSADTPMAAYVVAASLIKRVEVRLRAREGLEARDRNNLRFYVLAYLVWSKTGTTSPSAKALGAVDLDSLTDAEVDQCIGEVHQVYVKLGGTDQVAKGTELKTELLKNFGSEDLLTSLDDCK